MSNFAPGAGIDHINIDQTDYISLSTELVAGNLSGI